MIKTEVLNTLHEMNDLLEEAEKLHKQLVKKVRQARKKAYIIDESGYGSDDLMENFMDQFDDYESKVSEGLEESPLGMIKDYHL